MLAYHPQICKILYTMVSNCSKDDMREIQVKQDKKIVSYFKLLQIIEKRGVDDSIND